MNRFGGAVADPKPSDVASAPVAACPKNRQDAARMPPSLMRSIRSFDVSLGVQPVAQ